VGCRILAGGSVDDLYGNDGSTVDGEMSERTIKAVVLDMRKHGLTVELQILVDELVMLVADVQAHNDAVRALEVREEEKRAINRERMRAVRERARTCMHTPSPFPPMINKTSTPLSPPPESIRQIPSECPFFEEFWKVFPRKVGKGEARKAFRNALKRASAEEIVAGAKRYAATKPDPEFTKHPGPWLNADRWADEDTRKVVDFRMPAPRPYKEIVAERERKEQT
jgi:hypothetical protein